MDSSKGKFEVPTKKEIEEHVKMSSSYDPIAEELARLRSSSEATTPQKNEIILSNNPLIHTFFKIVELMGICEPRSAEKLAGAKVLSPARD